MRRVIAPASVLLVVAALVAGCGGEGGEDRNDTEAAAATDVRPAVEGNPEAGSKIYEEQGCGNCHTFAAAGSRRNVGPNLDLVAKEYDADFIRESIVDPAAYIEKGEAGRIGGSSEYGGSMPPTGPDAPSEQNRISEQELADLVAFLTEEAKQP